MSLLLPAEWEPQDGVLLGWPHEGTDWYPTLDAVLPVFAGIAELISRFERVVIAAPEVDSVRKVLRRSGARLDQIDIYQVATDDTWARDFGPMTVYEHEQPVMLDFTFNGWGMKFGAEHDNRITGSLHNAGAFGMCECRAATLVLEGGSLESDGAGTLLTTAACLLESRRNPHMTRGELEQSLLALFGGQRMLWLEHGYLAGDDTDSHIDTLARLAPGNAIIYQRCDDPNDEHYDELAAMENELRALKTVDGAPYRLHPLPWPEACYDTEGRRLPATYANYLVINGAVLVPVYGNAQDDAALAVIGRVFPGRQIIPVFCRPLIEQHGSLHCVTMQLPRGVLK